MAMSPCLCSIAELATIFLRLGFAGRQTWPSAACSFWSPVPIWNFQHCAPLRQLWIKLNIGRWLLKLHGLCLRRNFCQSQSLPLKVWASAGKQQEQKFLVHFELCPPRSCVTVILSLEEILQKKCDSNVAVDFWCFYAVLCTSTFCLSAPLPKLHFCPFSS